MLKILLLLYRDVLLHYISNKRVGRGRVCMGSVYVGVTLCLVVSKLRCMLLLRQTSSQNIIQLQWQPSLAVSFQFFFAVNLCRGYPAAKEYLTGDKLDFRFSSDQKHKASTSCVPRVYCTSLLWVSLCLIASVNHTDALGDNTGDVVTPTNSAPSVEHQI